MMNPVAVVVLLVILALSSFLSGMVILSESPRYKLGDQALEMIEECQAMLPRNTFCTLYAKEITE